LFIQSVGVGWTGDLDAARRVLDRMVELCPPGEVYYYGMAMFGRAFVEVQFGDLDQAEAAARDGMATIGENRFGAAYHLDAMAWIADRRGDHERAATLFGAAGTEWELVGSRPEVAVSLPHLQHVKRVRKAIGDRAYARAYAAGRAMSLDEAVRFALGGPADVLTRREREIAALIAEGLTNREIAQRLVIAERTAATHVQHILTKLGLPNRTRIAMWLADQRRGGIPESANGQRDFQQYGHKDG
jgi:non-specific serine/threonine protein kinase